MSRTADGDKLLLSSTQIKCLFSINFFLNAPLGTHFKSALTTNTETCTLLTRAAFLRFCLCAKMQSSSGSNAEVEALFPSDDELGNKFLIALALAVDINPLDISVALLVRTFQKKNYKSKDKKITNTKNAKITSSYNCNYMKNACTNLLYPQQQKMHVFKKRVWYQRTSLFWRLESETRDTVSLVSSTNSSLFLTSTKVLNLEHHRCSTYNGLLLSVWSAIRSFRGSKLISLFNFPISCSIAMNAVSLVTVRGLLEPSNSKRISNSASWETISISYSSQYTILYSK